MNYKWLRNQLIVIIIFIISITIIDYYNIPFKCNINVSNFNFDFWSILINVILVIGFYIVTYLIIDKRNLLKEKNKRNIAVLLMNQTYEDCLEQIDWMNKKDYRNHIADKTDFDDDINNTAIYKKICELPFKNMEIIYSFAQEGIISSDELASYLLINKEYILFLTMAIAFFDKYEYANDQKQKLEKIINESLLKKE